MTVDVKTDDLKKYVDSSRSEYEKHLKHLVDIPSVSMDPAHKGDIGKLAKTAATLLNKMGAKSQVIETDGNPVVIGEFHAGDQYPTVSIYNHLDVQPADPSEWKHPPFDMTIEDGVYRGRGATDDKGPALTVLFAAKYAHEHKIPVNIKFIWELEEEIGSPSFEKFLEKNKALLKTDSVAVSDTIWVSRERPAIPYGLRGLQGILIKLETGKKDVHSGLTGGLARNPIGELAQLLSAMYDAKTGMVNVPGFYDGVAKPTADELDNYKKSGFTVENFIKAHELKSVRTMDVADGSARIWAMPTFEIHGIVGGYTGPGIKTIVPHSAEAKISMRLVPDQNPMKIVENIKTFVKEHCPDAEVIELETLRPYIGKYDGKYFQAAKSAMTKAFGIEPAFTREGGSIGAVLSMNEVLGVPVVFLGLSLPEHGYHAINENFDWQQASGGMKMFVEYFSEVAKMK